MNRKPKGIVRKSKFVQATVVFAQDDSIDACKNNYSGEPNTRSVRISIGPKLFSYQMTQFLNGCFSHMTLRFHFKFYHSKNGQERPILNYRMSNGRAIGISKHLKTGPFDIWLSKHPVFGSPKYTCKNSYHVGCCLGE